MNFNDRIEFAKRIRNTFSRFHIRHPSSRLSQGTKGTSSKPDSSSDDSSSDDARQLHQKIQLLSITLQAKFQKTKEVSLLRSAIDLQRRLPSLLPKDDKTHVFDLCNLASQLGQLFEATNDENTLNEAIRVARQCLSLASCEHPVYVQMQHWLSQLLGALYEKVGDTCALDEALTRITQLSSLEVKRFTIQELQQFYCTLARLVSMHYKCTGDLKTLSSATQPLRRAMEISLFEDPKLRLTLQGQLIEHSATIYVRTGKLEHLDVCIKDTQLGLKIASVHAPEMKGYMMYSQGKNFSKKYLRTMAIIDLNQAIKFTQEGLREMKEVSEKVLCVTSLSDLLVFRYQRTKQSCDLREALESSQTVFQNLSRHEPNYPLHAASVANTLLNRYKVTKDEADLETVDQLLRHTFGRIRNPSFRASAILIFISCQEEKQRLRPSMKDLEEAIHIAKHAVEITTDAHLNKGAHLTAYGRLLCRRYLMRKEKEDLLAATTSYVQAWNLKLMPPINRLKAGVQAFQLLIAASRLYHAIVLGIDIISLIPIISLQSYTWNDQEQVFSLLADTSSTLCSLLIYAGRPEEAIESLEHSRAVIIGQHLDNNSDISRLRRTNPAILKQYQDLVNEINYSNAHYCDLVADHGFMERFEAATSELEKCLQQIRNIPGLERFLLGQSIAHIQESAGEGTIVIVNISSYRSDALLISRAGVQSLHLNKLLWADAKTWVNKSWYSKKPSQQKDKNDELCLYLAWLWSVCVKDVIEAIVVKQGSNAVTLEKVWWIGSGLGTSMPFHAAGVCKEGSTDNAYAHLISSYTPSIKALVHARRKKGENDIKKSDFKEMLIVTMPTTPKGLNGRRLPDLSGVLGERDAITKEVKKLSTVRITDLPYPSVNSVLHSLKKCSIAHFACHGISNPSDPSSSALILQCAAAGMANTDNVIQDKLTVKHIAQLQFEHAQLAYLSACSTAHITDIQLSNEVIHLVSGFQAAGFCHVIGTLWPIGDMDSIDIATGFYSHLLDSNQGPVSSNTMDAASALHHAVAAVRAVDPEAPLRWAPFVHFGA
ncbi:hypothetical protein VHEMI04684 [[Torrubiella] hemipterigena]|uniref:CHAT domain-containing protein n=1 Tax=[Torrubiella] hemipterigena TaxID=1531966 RepID=A0A0A1TF24_9HYPO|nr:hypothetical protein VHEMI04684 [[Torrubiella] hemipterigena]